MKKINNKKVFSGIAVLAITATAALGTISLAGLNNKDTFNYTPVSDAQNSAANTFSTALGAVPRSQGDIYYIDVNGTAADDGADGSSAHPYSIKELGNATLFKAGDTILINPGVYRLGKMTTDSGTQDEYISLNYSGTFDKYITIMNASAYNNGSYTLPTEEVVIDFSAQSFVSTNRGVHMYGSFIYWYGIDICGAGDNGLYISGSYNTIEYSEFYNNRDTGLQLGRAYSEQASINQWPSYNLIKNCTSHNNYDNETYGENADGFAAKLTIGYGNVFDGCIAYRNSDDGWDLYAKSDSGNIGAVIIYNSVAFENGYLEYTQAENNARFPYYDTAYNEVNTNSYRTKDGDGNGFKLGGSVMEGDVVMYNCLSFNNRMHGVTDNSNPGVLSITGVTSYDNGAYIDDNSESTTFGKIIFAGSKGGDDDTYGNIDVSRQTYSYNNLNKVLSAKSGLCLHLEADNYRASVRDSILGTAATGTKAYKIVGSLDADSKNGIRGTEINAPVASEIFEKLPIIKNADGTYTHNIDGLENLYTGSGNTVTLNSARVHKTYRNTDGSVNMKGMLEVQDHTKLLGEDNKIGSYLSATSGGAYTHFYASGDFVNGEAASDTAARLARIKEAVTINCDADNVYQDFDVPSLMTNATISWKSSDESILKVGTEKDVSVSGSEYYTVTVYRDATEDKTVTLTATITLNGAEITKTFTVTVKKDVPAIGTVYAVTSDGEIITDGSIIVDAYALYSEPVIKVENAADYNGKLLKESQYNVDSSYKYAPDKNSKAFEVKGFSPSTPGVYTVTKTVSLKDGGTPKTFSYYIYVASPAASVDFVQNKVGVTVNRDGVIIEGNLSNVTGTLYALTSPTQLSLDASSIKTQTGVNTQAFRGDSIKMQVENDNSGEYFIYYAIANVNGDITSQIYETKVNVVEVSDVATFTKIAKGTAVNGEEPAETIYLLTQDLDFADEGTLALKGTFKGLLNGAGHKLSNITATQHVFEKVTGGTIMNIKIDNLTINASSSKAGFIGTIHGGYVHNIQMTNVSVTSTAQRTGALIGQAEEGYTYISQISVVNDNEHVITSNSNRAAAILSFIQSTSGVNTDLYISISDCYVDSKITGNGSVAGIVGAFDGANSTNNYTFYLGIDHCVFAGEAHSTADTPRLAGMLGYHSNTGTTKLEIRNCLSIGELYTKSGELLTGAVKNASAIVGGFTATADATVYSCVGLVDEYNTNYRVDQYTMDQIANPSTFGQYVLDFDTDEKWTLTLTDNGDGTYSYEHGFITLNYLG